MFRNHVPKKLTSFIAAKKGINTLLKEAMAETKISVDETN